MKKILVAMILAAAVVGGYAFATGFSDVNSPSYWGKTDIPKLTSTLDGNFTQLEAGTVDIRVETITVDSTATFSGAVNVSGAVTFSGNMAAANISTTGTLTIAEGALTDSKVVEADLKVVDSPSDEDFLSYESTTGDFEWHSAAEIAGKFTEGVLADSVVVSADIKDGTIVAGDIATDGVEAAEIAADAVGNSELADNSVTTTNIVNGTIVAADLAADSVEASEIAADAVANSELADNAVTTTNIVDGTIVAGDLAADSVDASEIAADAVGNSELADNSVTTTNIVDGTIVAADLAADSVEASEIATDAVGNAELADSSVTTTNIVDDTITSSDLAADSVANSELADNAVTTTNIVDGTISNTDVANAAGIAVTKIAGTAVVGKNATPYAIDFGTVNSTSAAVQTNAFTYVFGAAPVVTCTYTEDPGAVRPIYITSITTTNFICTVEADKNFNWIAVGTAP